MAYCNYGKHLAQMDYIYSEIKKKLKNWKIELTYSGTSESLQQFKKFIVISLEMGQYSTK